MKYFFILNFFLCGAACIYRELYKRKYIQPLFGCPYRNIQLSTIINQKQHYQISQLRKCINLAAKNTPWKTDCLPKAMVAKVWCQFLKIPYVFYIGLAKDNSKSSGYVCHAWITAGPIIITGANVSLSSYGVISTYIFKPLPEGLVQK